MNILFLMYLTLLQQYSAHLPSGKALFQASIPTLPLGSSTLQTIPFSVLLLQRYTFKGSATSTAAQAVLLASSEQSTFTTDLSCPRFQAHTLTPQSLQMSQSQQAKNQSHSLFPASTCTFKAHSGPLHAFILMHCPNNQARNSSFLKLSLLAQSLNLIN